MTVATARAQVKTIMEGIAGVRSVMDYERYSQDAEAFFKKHFVRAGKVNGWVIKSTAMPRTVHTCSEDEKHYRFKITGWTSATDSVASLKTAETLMETIDATFAVNPRLNSTVSWSDKPEPQPIVTGLTALGDAKYLVHQFVLEFTAHERVVVTYA